MSRSGIDEKLFSWNNIKSLFRGHSILIRNGASCAIWTKFQYASVYEKAVSEKTLSEVDIRLCRKLGTTNLENVLSSLATTSTVLAAMGKNNSEIISRYQSIKNALVHSVKDIHLPWKCAQGIFSSIYSALAESKNIYTTNYDLVIYWSIIQGGDPSKFKDFFWAPGCLFDLKDTSVTPESIKLFYLHGGLHLESLPNGATHKRVNDGRTLLEQFGEPSTEGAIPLVVTEGTSEDKMNSIQNSSYLTYGYERFAIDRFPLVIIGHSLSDSDRHLIDVLMKSQRLLAISIYSHSKTETIEKKTRYCAKLPGLDLFFFDAISHPLCSPALHINEN